MYAQRSFNRQITFQARGTIRGMTLPRSGNRWRFLSLMVLTELQVMFTYSVMLDVRDVGILHFLKMRKSND